MSREDRARHEFWNMSWKHRVQLAVELDVIRDSDAEDYLVENDRHHQWLQRMLAHNHEEAITTKYLSCRPRRRVDRRE